MKLIIFGPQGSGKGTQAEKIIKKHSITHISTGDIFRDNIKRKTKLGKKVEKMLKKGNMVPDDITNKIMKERLAKKDCEKGFILDGYPRTKEQAEFLDKLVKIDIAINLEISKEMVIKRISSRRICQKCGKNFNVLYKKSKKAGICDFCNDKLITRADDKKISIEKRLANYERETKPLIKFYEKKGILIKIDGEQNIDKVTSNIINSISFLQQ
ncbi:adenylate kinase [Candidatus Woesearchaeota archaeon]|jgi:adenylate kinase|nr:adenylate kinase [Candidatus Woesearchaeota archaeon]|tara:strand:- start:28 stop:666 length:639 start_codon:yes stop_codon:yes gene_type:complete